MIKVNGLSVSRIPVNGKETLRVMKNGQQLWSGTGLPGGYTLLEYIQSTGSQYINTGFKPNNNTKFVLDVMFLSAKGQNVAGVRDNAGVSSNRFGIVSESSTSKFAYFFGSSFIRANTYDNNRHIYELDKNGMKVDNNSYGSLSSASFSCVYPITLGAWNEGANGISYNNSKIYSCQIYDNGELVRDFIPCKNPSGVCGLYDKVNKVFYGSASSTGFSGT